ncbi:hypothetical protein GGI07_004946 [Coemansia sp. Benny D115]|nr:hypothetical protein GGI07_004946 [Coemansia sp. Benny D115]
MLAGRWEKVSTDHISAIFHSCQNIRELNINLCQNVVGEKLVELFERHPSLCSSLRLLDMSETMFSDEIFSAILKLTDKLTSLMLNETAAGSETIGVITSGIPNLEWLELDMCEDLESSDIVKIKTGCEKLTHIIADGPWIDDASKSAIDSINARGEWEDDGFETTSDYYSEYSDYSDVDELELGPEYDHFRIIPDADMLRHRGL